MASRPSCCSTTGRPQQRELSRDEALAEIALRYFRSHGPTTRKDLVGWTGMTASDAKAGIAACGDALKSVQVDGAELVLAASLGAGATRVPEWLALPGFDEYLLGFKERSLMVDAAGMDAVIPGKNGVFRSTIVRDGRVVATWKRALTSNKVTVDVVPLPRRVPRKHRAAVEAALQPYAAFVERDLVVRWP